MPFNNNNCLLNAVVKRINDIPSAVIDDEIVMMHIEKGKYYGLDPVGSRIWGLMENPQIVSSIVKTLLEEYDVDTMTCEQQVLEFINKLKDEELIVITDLNEGCRLL
ncbi:lasso peptide biosynthesis PqqD family chaperone [Desulfosporosinus youngiae]|uniref:Coenzyme PQQ synthesis protein D (PqqD) n=1 Tax=Desulfosporosinus youngiae DSM 17734 TaxID=768710 RepID=H5XUE7_9FIRM|nr:lasso peptide biosynthesis PqqD family chaperone [Desulfosporosinus youngiae]EHQ89383.1 Coenzyme PQQ synthesis protein D (PqqD) [Desulfosporosinus youngiae DSM 17734]